MWNSVVLEPRILEPTNPVKVVLFITFSLPPHPVEFPIIPGGPDCKRGWIFSRLDSFSLLPSLYEPEEEKQPERETQFALQSKREIVSRVQELQVDTMASTSVWPMLLLLLVFLGPLPASAQRETRYQKFVRQHIDFPKTSPDLDARRYCNLMMQRRMMTKDVCKYSNTFIHGSPEDVDAICNHGGTHSSENYYDSNAPFQYTYCRNNGGSQRPPCNYRGRVNTQHIRVACVNGLPVHFKGTL